MGGPRRSEASFQPFNSMIDLAYLQELQLYGNRFTWDGMRRTLWIQSKLDRCLGNKTWLHLFPASNQTFLEKRGYDHILVLVKLIAYFDSYQGSFTSDSRFLNKPLVKETIKKALTNHPLLGESVAEKWKRCKKSLRKWKEQNLNARDKIYQLEKNLEKEQSAFFLSCIRVEYLKKSLVKEYKEEEKYWSQKIK